jgi:hypothetical protein
MNLWDRESLSKIMAKKTLRIAQVTFDLAETTRMIEIANGIINPKACQLAKGDRVTQVVVV